MTRRLGTASGFLARAAGFASLVVFCLPGGAVLVELVCQSARLRFPAATAPWLAGAAALLITTWMLSAQRVASSAGWAVALMGHAALANAMSPGKPIGGQLLWLGTGAAIGAAMGAWMFHRPPVGQAAPETGAPAVAQAGRSITWTVFAVACVVGCLLLVLLERDHQRVAWQNQFAAAVSRSRGHILFDDYGATLVFGWRQRFPEREMETRKSLRCIDLGPAAGDGQLAELVELGMARLPDLSDLRLARSRVTDEGLVLVAPMVRLDGLSLGQATTDAGLACLRELNSLRTLDLTHTQVTGHGLRYPYPWQLPQLETLILRGTKVSDDQLGHLKIFPRLMCLDLSGTRITDAGLAHLIDLPRLQTLILGHTRISDAGVVYLKQMPALHWLIAIDTQLTEAGRASLRVSRPGMQVAR